MQASIIGKMIFAFILQLLKLNILNLRIKQRDTYLILMYHRVIAEPYVSKWLQPGMYVKENTFKMHLDVLNKYFSIVPIMKIGEENVIKRNRNNEKMKCILTFDDGYSDFFSSVYPLLLESNTPATVFLPTGFIGTKEWFWTDKFAFALYKIKESIGSCSTMNVSPSSDILKDILSINEKFEKHLELAIQKLKKQKSEKIEHVIEELFEFAKIDKKKENTRIFMTWDQVREMATSELINFGSHTDGHHIMTTLTEKQMRYELLKSKEKLLEQEIVESNFIPFCYPNGNWNNKIAGLVRKANYKVAVTTKKGYNHLNSNQFSLNRIGLHQDVSSNAFLLMSRVANFI